MVRTAIILPPPLLRRAQGDLDDTRHDSNNLEEDTPSSPPRLFPNPCEISNDPAGGANGVSVFNPNPLATCGITEYRCGDSTDNDRSQLVELVFQLDVYANADAQLDDPNNDRSAIIAYVEEHIFREVAEALGIDDCRMILATRRRALLEYQRELLLFPGANGLLTTPTDVPDPDREACTSSYTSSTGNALTCFPVLGGFTVLGNDTDVDFATAMQGLFGFVRDLTKTDALEVDSLIEKVVYVGKYEGPPLPADDPFVTRRPPADPIVDEPGNKPPASSSNDGSVALLTSLAAGLAALVLVAFFVVRRSRSSKQDQSNSTPRSGVVVLQEVDDHDFFDVTESPKQNSLAVKDSLALQPQPNIPLWSNGQQVDGEATTNHDAYSYSASPSSASVHALAVAERAEVEVQLSVESRATAEDTETDKQSDDGDLYVDSSSLFDGLSADADDDGPVDNLGPPPPLLVQESVASGDSEDEELYDSSQLRVGLSLSRISETSLDDVHDLEFGEIFSTASYDTRQSARRHLQMT